ncbi:N-acetylneuraminate synthase [Natronogracilivirga saccharolytica]|uniref:N-acetylneuraminate synthase n=1 Tax=Natronogracilivirga saccharolytica TaxID=2812953 RepID=A0A8J7S8J4_9BACT|nr:N-acetylneuraminate synthase [Natronogracilivirga saccharolytica]MBP3193948.1 N-acetylneuraminate synthase [Natronogracilivirga saccharolytica]
MSNGIKIIAEAGVNHNGSMKLAEELIDAAAEAGADFVKFQSFRADGLVSKNAPKADYQNRTTDVTESQYDMIRRLELQVQDHERLISHCRSRGIGFLSSPFDHDSIDLLDRLGLDIFKVPSGDVTNLPYLRKLGALKKQVILSTGMADMKEVGDALQVLVSGGTPKSNITVLHCNTEYPTPFEDVNLRAMQAIKRTYDVNIGYSDHTTGIEIPLAAAALGATVIEKHFTLDRNMEGPDHKASLEPDELQQMVAGIWNVEKALGSETKKPSPSEAANIPVVRKSIVAATDIAKGDEFTEGNLAVKRPGSGLSPMLWDEVLGRKAEKDFMKDELITI